MGDGATPEPVRRVGLVGPSALEAAMWWCAQVAARTGGAVVFLPPTGPIGNAGLAGSGAEQKDELSGQVRELFVLGDGSTPIHVVDSDLCPHCDQSGAATGGGRGTVHGSTGPYSPGPHPPDEEAAGRATAAHHTTAPQPGDHPGAARQVPGRHTADEGGSAAVGTRPALQAFPAPGPRAAPPVDPSGAPPAVLHIGVARDYRSLPPWCDRVVEDPDPPVSPLWWRQVAHAVPADQGSDGDREGPPSCVLLAELSGLSPDAPTGDGPAGLPALIGMDEGGPVTIDLVRDGPHALLAGTTGSGKSEALATWLLSLTRNHSPDRLRLVLIDYKGGAALRPFAALPHTEEVLTDLDPSATERALTGLGALLVRRERELADVGVPDLARWELAHARGQAPPPPPRVLVVVDEFRILADSHPATLETLVRLAAQGRSLGLHLVAATQRPAGALTPAMRANIEVRLALRCAEEADSLDVLGSPAAARLPRLPGRAVLRGGGVLQVAWVPDIDREVAEVSRLWPPAGSGHLWPPDLPEGCTWSEIPSPVQPASASTPADPSALPLALADRISATSHGPLLWRCGGISVEGPAHRTGELETLALSLGTRIASAGALPLHVCSHPRTRPEGCATWIRPDEPGPVSMLLEGILGHGPAVLVATDVQSMTEGMDRTLGPGQGRAWWGRILASAERAGVVLVLTRPSDAGGAASGGTPHLPHRLLVVGSSEEALRSGLPANAPTSQIPGRVLARGFDEGASGHLRCQVPLEPHPPPVAPPAPAPAHAAPPWCVRSTPDGDGPLPDWALGWAGPELLPLRVPTDLDWVVVATDPGPALVRLAALCRRPEDSAPSAPDAARGPRSPAHSSLAPVPGPVPVPGITVVHPDQWPTLRTLGSRPLIALDPSEEVLRMLATSSRDVPRSLRAMEWGPHSGIVAHAGRVTRLVLPTR